MGVPKGLGDDDVDESAHDSDLGHWVYFLSGGVDTRGLHCIHLFVRIAEHYGTADAAAQQATAALLQSEPRCTCAILRLSQFLDTHT